MKIRLETELDWRELDAFIEGVSGATFFQSSTFLTGLEAFCGYSVLALTLREGGALAALLPFAEKRRRGFSPVARPSRRVRAWSVGSRS